MNVVKAGSAHLRADPSSPDAALAFDQVSMTFLDGTAALLDVSIPVRPGEPIRVRKSTLLRIASALTPATSGTVAVETERVGFVFQDPTLHPGAPCWATPSCSSSSTGCPGYPAPGVRRSVCQLTVL